MIEVEELEKIHYNNSLQYVDKNKIVGCFLRGSQNYNLNTEESDVDSVLVVTPSLKDLCNECKVSEEHIWDNEEHTDIKDIRRVIELFKKQNPAFVEILFTPFRYFPKNAPFRKYWDLLISIKEQIARYDPERFLSSIIADISGKSKTIFRASGSREQIVLQKGYCPKDLHHIIRLNDLLEKYINNKSYRECLDSSDNKTFLIDVKMGKFTETKARDILHRELDRTANLKYNFYKAKSWGLIHDVSDNKDIEAKMDEICFEIIRESIKKEC